MIKKRVCLNSCEILIDSIKIDKQLETSSPFLYFHWKKGRKQVSSELIQLQFNQTIYINQKLQLGLKLSSFSGKPQPKTAHFVLIVCDDKQQNQQELCSFALAIHQWTEFYQRIKLQVKQEQRVIGFLNIQVKRKEVMQLENFPQYSAEIQESEEQQKSKSIINDISDVEDNHNQNLQLKNEIEDLKYLNEKLKKDRTFLISRNEKVEKEARQIKQGIHIEIQRLQQYYKKKLSIHSSVYHEEIQYLIKSFNETSNTNTLIMKSIITENEQLSAELSELRIISEQELDKQQQHYKQKLSQAQQEIQSMEEHIQNLEDKVEKYEKLLQQFHLKEQKTKEELEHLSLEHQLLKKEKNEEKMIYEREQETLKKRITEYKNEKQELQVSLKEQKSRNEELSKTEETQLKELQEERIERIKLQDELQNKKTMVEIMEKQKKQIEGIYQRLEQNFEKEKNQNLRKILELERYIGDEQLKYRQKQMENAKQISELDDKNHQQSLQILSKDADLKNMSQILIIKEEETKAYLQDINKLKQQLLRFEQLQQQKKIQSQRTQFYKNLYEQGQAKLIQMKLQIENLELKKQEEFRYLRDELQKSIQARQKYYEKEIQQVQTLFIAKQAELLGLTNQLRMEKQATYELQQIVNHIKQQRDNFLKQTDNLSVKVQTLGIEIINYKNQIELLKFAVAEKDKRYEEATKFYQSSLQNFEALRQSENNQQIKSDRKSNRLKIRRMKSEEDSQPKDNQSEKSIQRTVNLKIPSQKNIQKVQVSNSAADLQYARYMKSVEEQNLHYMKNAQEMQNESLKLKIELEQARFLNIKYEGEISQFKEQIDRLNSVVEDLKQQLLAYLEKEDEMAQSKHSNKTPYLAADQSFRSEPNYQMIKNLGLKKEESENRMQIVSNMDQKDKASSNRSRRSSNLKIKIVTPVDTKQFSAQVDILSSAQVLNLQKRVKQVEYQLSLTRTLLNQSEQKYKKPGKTQKNEIIGGSGIPPKQNKQITVLQKQNSLLTRKIEELQRENYEKSEEIRLKEIKIDKIQQRNRQVFDELIHYKQQAASKLEMQQSKFLEYSELSKRDEQQFAKMRKTVVQKEQQLRETNQKVELQKSKLISQIEELSTQNKKLKKEIEEIQEKGRRSQNFDIHRIFQQDIEDANKKIIELNRLINQMRMEKESAEDEIKMLKKKHVQQEKLMNQFSQKKSKLEEESDAMERRLGKLKRDYDAKDEDLCRAKQKMKQLQQQINSFNSIVTKNANERKKLMDEKIQLQQQGSKKDSEIRKLNKQLSKYMDKASQNEDFVKDRKRESSKEMERLQLQLIKLRKANSSFEQQNLFLKERMTSQQQQLKLKIEDLKNNYKQKLSSLINEIGEIKQIQALNNEEISHLLAENSNLKQQVQNLEEENHKLLVTKDRNDQKLRAYEQELHQLSHHIEENKKQLIHYQEDSIQLHNKIAQMEQQLNKERLVSMKKSEKMQQFEMLAEKYLYQIKGLKLVISQYQKKQKNQQNTHSAIQQLDKQNSELKQQLIPLLQQYQAYKSKFVYTKQQMEQLVSEMKQSFDEMRRKELADTIDELDQQYEAKNIKREKQIIDLFNQNTKCKLEIEKKQDENSKLLQKITEIEGFPAKYLELKQVYQRAVSEVSLLKQQLVQSKSKSRKQQTIIKQNERAYLQLKHQVSLIQNNLAIQKSKVTRLENQLIQSQTSYNYVKEELKRVGSQNSDKTDKQKNVIQSYEQKILSIQLENIRIKEREENMHREYKQQIEKLEKKIKQATHKMEQQNVEVEKKLKNKLGEKDRLLVQANKTINAISAQIKSFQTQISELKSENDDLQLEVSSVRMEMSQSEQIYINQINKLKNNIKEMEDFYNQNTKQLEEQLAEANRQLTIEKLNSRQAGLGLSSSRLRQSHAERRLEQKLKAKDEKIEQLKKNIMGLEETLISARRKYEQIEGKSMDWKNKEAIRQISELKKEMKEQEKRKDEIVWQLKKENTKLKEFEKQIKLQVSKLQIEVQQKNNELRTVKELYINVQRQIERRQIKLSQNVSNQQRLKRQVEERLSEIRQLTDENQQLKNELKSLEQRISKQNNSREVEIKQSILDDNKRQAKNIHNLKKENKIFEEQNRRIRKQNEQFKQKISLIQSQQVQIKNELVEQRKQRERFQKKYRESNQGQEYLKAQLSQWQNTVSLYNKLNEQSLKIHGVQLDQLVQGGFFQQKIFDQEQEMNQLRGELQQSRFIQQKLQFELQQCKKQLFQMQLKLDDNEFTSDQVDELRKICDKMQQEKKIAVFREEALRIRLRNILNQEQNSNKLKQSLKAIINLQNSQYY